MMRIIVRTADRPRCSSAGMTWIVNFVGFNRYTNRDVQASMSLKPRSGALG